MANKTQSHYDTKPTVFCREVYRFKSAKEKCEHNKKDQKQF